MLGPKHTIKDFKKCDFRPIKDRLDELKEIRKNRSSEAKQIEKSEENLGKIRDEVKELNDKVEQERETYVV